MQLFKNNASSLLVANITNVSLSLQVSAGEGALFPSPTGGDYFLLTLSKIYSGIETIIEIVKVTARSGDVFTIVRAQEGTTNNAYVMGDHVALRSTAASFTAYETLLASLNSGPLAGFRNKVINGGFDVPQRGVSFVNPTTTSATLDRWFTYRGANATGLTASQSAVVPTGFANSLKLLRTPGDTSVQPLLIQQSQELLNSVPLQGAKVTLSFWAKTGANQSFGNNLTCFVVTGATGNEPTTSMGIWAGNTNVIGQAFSLTGGSTWTKYSLTSVACGSSIKQIGLQLAVTPTGTAGADDSIYITGVQLEVGSIATPFEFRPYSIELALCQRYYQRIKHEQRVYAPAASANGFTISHPTMRVQPTWSTLTTGTLVNASTATAVAYSDSQALLTLNSSAAGDNYITARVYESTGTEL